MARLLVRRDVLERWGTFAVIAFAVAMLLAFRPITTTDSDNDTGRYIFEMHAYCEGQSAQNGLALMQTGPDLMYYLTGSCLFNSERLFLFLAALTIPGAYLAFAGWNRGDGLIAASAMFSVVGVELMTNALRTGFALFFFFGALRVGQARYIVSAALFGVAGSLHSSLLFYFPVLYFVWLGSLNRRVTHVLTLVTILLSGSLVVLNRDGAAHQVAYISDFGETYSLIYALDVNYAFVLFMLAPLFATIIARYVFDRSALTRLEVSTFLYSTALISIAVIFFTYITYRFVIVSVAIQLFVITLSGSRSTVAKKTIFAVMSTQLVAMLLISSNYDYIWQ